MKADELLIQFNIIKNGFNALADSYKNIIKDKNLPLELRWEVYQEAPIQFKKTKGWIEHFKSIESVDEDAIMYEGNLLHAERYETITVEMILDSIYDSGEERWINIINDFKEEVLEKNIDSFVYDW